MLMLGPLRPWGVLTHLSTASGTKERKEESEQRDRKGIYSGLYIGTITE